jgi:hypothetical protein
MPLLASSGGLLRLFGEGKDDHRIGDEADPPTLVNENTNSL